jgi:prepilin signal peptidase PulO-like enzyme (type II secretory pathway)
MADIVLGMAMAVGGLALIVWRRQFAASTVRQQNRFWRTSYGPLEVAFNERAAILIGIFALAMALSIWLGLFWPPLIVLVAGVLALNLSRLRRRKIERQSR